MATLYITLIFGDTRSMATIERTINWPVFPQIGDEVNLDRDGNSAAVVEHRQFWQDGTFSIRLTHKHADRALYELLIREGWA